MGGEAEEFGERLQAAVRLREQRRFDEADAAFAALMADHPDEFAAACGRAWVAHARGDGPEAVRRWAALRAVWPDRLDGYFGGGASLVSEGRFEEAEAVYRETFRRFPAAEHVLEDFARLALRQTRFEQALERWSALRVLFPASLRGYRGAAETMLAAGCLDDALSMLARAEAVFPENAAVMITRARLLHSAGRLSEALAAWDAVFRQFHGLAEGYLGAAEVLCDLQRFADAETVLLPALRLFPEQSEVVVRYAWLAHYRQAWDDAATRWAEVRTGFPGLAVGYSGGVASLRGAAKLAEAEALANEGRARFADDYWLALEWAHNAIARERWRDAARRLAEIQRGHPAAEEIYPLLAEALMKAGNAGEAERMIKDAMGRLGDRPVLLIAFAKAVMPGGGAGGDAEARWREALEKQPGSADIHAGLANALREAGRLEDSDAVAEAALGRFPGHLELERALAQNASCRRDWPRALALWAGLKARHPTHGPIKDGVNDALWQARQDLAVAEASGQAAPFEIPPGLLEAPPARADEAEVRELLMGFESIGDTCEFGIVQRRYGAEPISLLRWASTNPDMLVAALDDNLAGVGEAENVVLQVTNGEYTTSDRRYHMFSHTFTRAAAQPFETFFAQQCRRMQFLRRKLLEDVAGAEKIFVYKSDDGLSLAQARDLWAALRRHGGRVALFCMRLAERGREVGMLEMIEDGLFVGYADRFSTVDINVENWVTLCRQVRERWAPPEPGV